QIDRYRFTLFHLLEYLFTLVGLLLFLLDIALDIWTVVSFYQDGAYVYMAVMIFLLLGSPVLLQVFSWLWYAGVIETSTRDVRHPTNSFTEGVAVYLNHDLQMLRLFETFSESAPQLTLMICVTRIPAAIASSVAMYHRSMRIYLPEKRKMSWISTGVYFLWNLLVIIPRVTALALFCSVLPCYIIVHFLSLWMLLVLVAWSQKTNYMEHRGWEWLYRAAVGLIWYFCWFNVTKKSIKLKMALYYSFMALDTVMLLGFWCWKVFEYAGCLYVFGILVKIIYYRCFHPNGDREKITEPTEGNRTMARSSIYSLAKRAITSLDCLCISNKSQDLTMIVSCISS
uniref:XK-related protein n=1 Tax=Sinocyclocheilus rhinocerous TaxID=307959 RepID=A0A673I8H9_9TELE